VRHVPRDVAVHKPGARVIRLKGDNDPPASREHGNVPARGVLAAKAVDVPRLVENVARLGERGGVRRAAEDHEVVAVQVEGVREGEAVGVVLD
jgi:hypothetical protein